MIDLKNVSFRYTGSEGAAGGADEAVSNGSLKNISLTIDDGECVLLTGGSGCGKTTILRLINGLIPNFFEGEPDGSVTVDGTDVSRAELYDTAKTVSTVFQNPRSQFFNVDTTSELAFACENRGMSEEEILLRVRQTVEELHLEPLMDRSLFNLSGGQKQKIACASVAVTQNKIILLDEPSANLDTRTIGELRELLAKWKAEGKTIVIAEHRISYLWQLADRTVVLQNGEILAQLDRARMDAITEEELHQMGLRSNKAEFGAQSGELSRQAQPPHVSEKETPLPSAAQAPSSAHGGPAQSPGTPSPSIQIQGFRYKYKNGCLALNVPRMEIPQGKITALIGDNGQGKTTFLNCLCGLGHRSRGSIIYNGKKYGRRARLKQIFLVMQDVNHQLFTESVLDEILISQREENEYEARSILQSLDLLELADRHPQSLSGGQKQRVAVACAVASGRDIMLFDEPTSGLDYTHMRQIGKILRDLKALGKTVIVVTHDRELIKECCDTELSLAEYNKR